MFKGRKILKVLMTTSMYNFLMKHGDYYGNNRVRSCFLAKESEVKTVRNVVAGYIFLDAACLIKKMSPIFYNAIIDVFLANLKLIKLVKIEFVYLEIKKQILDVPGQDSFRKEYIERIINNVPFIFKLLMNNTYFDCVIYSSGDIGPKYFPSISLSTNQKSPSDVLNVVNNFLTAL